MDELSDYIKFWNITPHLTHFYNECSNTGQKHTLDFLPPAVAVPPTDISSSSDVRHRRAVLAE